MAPLTKSAVTARIKLILEQKFETHKADVASDVEPIRELKVGPLGSLKTSPGVGVYYERHTGQDAPQQAGESRDVDIIVESLFELPSFSDEHCRRADDFSDALEWTLKQERELLHPTAGTRLPWTSGDCAYPGEGETRWLHRKGRAGGFAHHRIRVSVTIDEAESY